MGQNKSIVDVWLEDGRVYVSNDGGVIMENDLNNSWLWVLGAICDDRTIRIHDNRSVLQAHQKRLNFNEE